MLILKKKTKRSLDHPSRRTHFNGLCETDHCRVNPRGEKGTGKMGKGESTYWSHDQQEQWQLRWNAYLTDTVRMTRDHEIDQQRGRVREDLEQLLQSFLAGRLTVKEFNALFQQKAHHEHNAFHLRGMSGGMFFHKLVKYLPDDQQLSVQLRTILVVPKETREGQRRMLSFTQFLEAFIAQHTSSREQLQPARLPFFLSAWWHVQNPAQWPIFYPLAHSVLLAETQRQPSPQGTISDYFLFRTQFLTLAKTLHLSLWELEHLLTWYGEHSLQDESRKRVQKRSPRSPRRQGDHQKEEPQHPSLIPPPSSPHKEGLLQEEAPQHERERHTHLQWLLAKIGQKIGCSVWIAINDHQKVWQQERLGDLSVSSLPQFTASAFQHIIRRIDVLWLQQDTVVAAYEIEHTTDIVTGLLRLYDLGALCTQADYLCIVAPQERFRRIQFELSRPSLQRHELSKKCGLITEELLLKHEEHILRWAGSLSVIEQLLSPPPSTLLLSS